MGLGENSSILLVFALGSLQLLCQEVLACPEGKEVMAEAGELEPVVQRPPLLRIHRVHFLVLYSQ